MNRQISEAPEDHEYHSRLEFDDSTGWHVYIVPALMLLAMLGVVLSILLMQ
ncbi:MAG TPA: hypothetical protein VNT25_07330 [Allosphingosinicella sp.]|nr:hypothetical protein [Allosphingosinicella sp.]